MTHLENPAPICDNHSLVTLDGGNTGVAQLIICMNTMLWTWVVCIHIDNYMDIHGILLDVSLWLWIMALAKSKWINGWLTSEYWEQEGNCHCL